MKRLQPSDIAPGTSTALETRMRLHIHGQAHWPEPLLNRDCTNCHHYDDSKGKDGLGICHMVHILNRKMNPKPFDGGKAIACTKWRDPEPRSAKEHLLNAKEARR